MKSARFLVSFTLVFAVISAAVTVAGGANTGGIAPQARATDVATLTKDHEPAVAVADTW